MAHHLRSAYLQVPEIICHSIEIDCLRRFRRSSMILLVVDPVLLVRLKWVQWVEHHQAGLQVHPRASPTATLISSRPTFPSHQRRFRVCCISSNSNFRSRSSTNRVLTRWPNYTKRTETRNRERMLKARRLRATGRYSSCKRLSNGTRICTF